MRILVIVTAVVVAASAGCKKPRDTLAAELDQACRDAVADGLVADARPWLAVGPPAHIGSEVDVEEMRGLAESFTAGGATRVQVAYVEVEDVQIGGMLVVDLPRAAAARADLFRRYAELVARLELDPVADHGQPCLLVGLD